MRSLIFVSCAAAAGSSPVTLIVVSLREFDWRPNLLALIERTSAARSSDRDHS
jgi:hypothetical protein